MAAQEEVFKLLDLLVFNVSDRIDQYAKEVDPPLPLAFDRVNQGQPLTSNAFLFRFPVEIIGEILQYVPQDSLAQVALVNRDFQQLARSRQFASVRLDYSDATLELVEKLVAEERERPANSEALQSRSIGPCIRRVAVATNPEWIVRRHDLKLEDLEHLPYLREDRRMKDASAAFFGCYVPRLLSLLPTLPNLERLDWEDNFGLPQSFFNSLACLHIRHLKLSRPSLEDEFHLAQPNAYGNGAWPLRTLHLELKLDFGCSNHTSTLVLCANLLRSCASTLEELAWILIHLSNEGVRTTAMEALDTLPRFTALRSLTLGMVGLTNPHLLNCLVQHSLRTLVVNTESSPIYTDFFRQRGSVRSLENFTWDLVLANSEAIQKHVHKQIDR